MDNIPKIIHYCWLGKNEKSNFVKQCIESWKQNAPDYEIKEWNEDNFPFEIIKFKSRYVTEAIDNRAWAFVTDYMRLHILYNEGGIYLDTDVELRKPLDLLLDHKSFMSFESENTLCTAVIGSQAKQDWVKFLLDCYDKRSFIVDNRLDKKPNSQYLIEILKQRYNIEIKNKQQSLNCGLIVYSSEYFSPKNYATMKLTITENTFAIHHYSGGWKSNTGKLKDMIVAIITRIIGESSMNTLKNKTKKKLRL